MAAAARYLKMSYDTFRSYAAAYGIFNSNQGGKGRQKPKKYKCREDVFIRGKVTRATVKKWFCEEVPYECRKCGNSGEWNELPLVLELEHIDGNSENNTLENLQLLCPNCHSQTSTFRGRKNR